MSAGNTRVRSFGQHTVVERFEDAIALVQPDVVEILAPGELVYQLVLHRQRPALQNSGQHLRQGDEAVGEIGRQASDVAIQGVARAGIGGRPNGRCARARSGGCGLEFIVGKEGVHAVFHAFFHTVFHASSQSPARTATARRRIAARSGSAKRATFLICNAMRGWLTKRCSCVIRKSQYSVV